MRLGDLTTGDLCLQADRFAYLVLELSPQGSTVLDAATGTTTEYGRDDLELVVDAAFQIFRGEERLA